MSANRRFASFASNPSGSTFESLYRRLLIWFLYLPAIVATVLGAALLSLCWLSLTRTNPPMSLLLTMGLLDACWVFSISDVWLQNTYYILHREGMMAARAMPAFP